MGNELAGKVPSPEYTRALEEQLNNDPQFNIELLTFRLFELASETDRVGAVSIMEEMGKWYAILDNQPSQTT